MTSRVAEKQFDLHKIALEGYEYFYPLLTMEMTRRQVTNSPPEQSPGRGPMNTFAHIRQFPTADWRDVVRPNFDTLYSLAWLDLSDGPVIVSAPDTDGRYYLLPMLDMWTDVFAVPGWRTSGTGSAAWGIVPPGWTGALPEGVSAIHAPTPTVWIVGRTKTDGPADYQAVNQVQDSYTITPLSNWGKPAQPVRPTIDPTVDMKTEPLRQVNALPAAEYFKLAAELMKAHPPHLTDWSILARLRRLGIVPGESYDPTPEQAAALDGVPAEAQQHMQATLPILARVANGWSMNTNAMGVYGDYYVKRAVVAMAGLGANQVEDAIYPLQLTDADGQPRTAPTGTSCTSTPVSFPRSTPSGPSPCTTRRASRSPTRSTGSPSATGTPYSPARTARWTSSCRTRHRAPTRRATGYPRRAVRSASACVCTRPDRKRWTAAGTPRRCDASRSRSTDRWQLQLAPLSSRRFVDLIVDVGS